MTRLRRQEERSIFKTLSLLFALLFLAACGGGGGGGGQFHERQYSDHLGCHSLALGGGGRKLRIIQYAF